MGKEDQRSLTPRLRFPEFRDTPVWEEQSLGDIAQISSGTTPLRANSEFYEGGSIPWVKTTDLNNSFIETTEECITPKARAAIHPVGSVLVAMYGGFKQIGRTGYLRVPAATNQALSVLRVKNEKVLPIYLLKWLNARIEDWKRIASSSRKDPNITGSDVASFPIRFPSTSEQQKIADCLTSLDELIAAQGRKVEALKAHKKGLMQQLFPGEGETRPRLRFPEFRDGPAWSHTKLGDFAEVKASGDLDSTLFSKTRSDNFLYPIYSNSVENQGLYGYYSIPHYRKGSVSITARGTLGIAFHRDHDFMGIGRLLVVSELNHVDPHFLTACWNHLARIPQEVTSIPQLTAVAARATILPIPNEKEQQRIADCLSTLDARIAAETEKVAALKTHKKGLMQQLFPAAEGE